MQLHLLYENNSLLNHFLAELRDVTIQSDRMRFRRNIERIGEVMAYEISKELHYQPHQITTPLGIKHTHLLSEKIVICPILRAGLALHHGFLNQFDRAESGFIAAYRHHENGDDAFEIRVEYQAAPSFDGKTLLLIDPMLATGKSIVAVTEKLLKDHQPTAIHIAVVIAAPEGLALLQEKLDDRVHLWIASMDDRLNEKAYIIPGLGDAGDLAYGTKL